MKLISLFLLVALVALPTAGATNSSTTSTSAANSTTETSSTNATGLLNPILDRCVLKADDANYCIQALVIDPEECATCIGDFVDNTLMAAFPSTADSSSNSSSSISAASTCDDLRGQVCSTLTGTCSVCKECKFEIDIYLGCGIGATAKDAGLSCAVGSSRNLEDTLCSLSSGSSGSGSSGSGSSGSGSSGSGSSGARVSHDVLVATMVAIATCFVAASV